MKYLICFLFMLTGCPSPGLYQGPMGMASQQGYTLNTDQRCIKAKETVDFAESVMPIIVEELKKAGYITRKPDYSKIMLCTVERPEPCSGGGWTLGPWKEIDGRKIAARKRGCTIGSSIWVSYYWPPICTKEWPDEPAGASVAAAKKYCVESAGKTTTTGWKAILAHELFNMAVVKWSSSPQLSGNYYRAKIYEVEKVVSKRLKDAGIL